MSDGKSKRETLYDDGEVTLRQYQTGRYGLTVNGLRVLFDKTETPTATTVHCFYHQDGTQVADINRFMLPHEVTVALDEIEEDITTTNTKSE